MKPKQQVIYLLSGTAHLPYCVVSAYTLRQHWKGNIVIYAWPESYSIAKQIAADPNIDAYCYEREPKYRRKDGVRGNSQFIDKISLMRSLNCETALYLDCDTTIHRSIDPLFRMLNGHEFLATQFCSWYVNSKMIRGRVSRALGIEGINQKAVQRVLDIKAPSVNGGVFVCRPETEILKTWYDWTLLIKKVFIADECVLHSLIGEYESTEKFVIAMGGFYNSAPKFQNIDNKDVVIRHYHGDSNVRPNKCPIGIFHWWPIYKECLEKNIGNIRDWKDDCRNKYIPKLENRPDEVCLYCGVNFYQKYQTQHRPKCPLRNN